MITDREKVLKELGYLSEMLFQQYQFVHDADYYDAFRTVDDAIDMLKAQPKWIPVEEKLPDKDGRYLVCDGGDVLEACFSPTGQLRRNQNGGFDRLPSWSTTDCYESEDLDHVTHWMPLPNPPEGE